MADTWLVVHAQVHGREPDAAVIRGKAGMREEEDPVRFVVSSRGGPWVSFSFYRLQRSGAKAWQRRLNCFFIDVCV